MALISCPECGHQVSSSASACPSCGFGISVHTSTSGVAKRRTKHELFGKGGQLQILALVAGPIVGGFGTIFAGPVIGLLAGFGIFVYLIIKGQQESKVACCGGCGAKLPSRDAAACPSCRARMA